MCNLFQRLTFTARCWMLEPVFLLLGVLFMATKDEVNALVSGINDRLTKISADITAIKAQLPTEGGLTAAEVAELKASLQATLDSAAAIDDSTPEAAV